MAPPIHLRVFLSSPDDVASERAAVRSVVEQMQYDPFIRGRATFEVVAWDIPGAGAPVTATATPQSSIGRGLPRPADCDIVVVVLWSRMGTPLPFPEYQNADGRPFQSGTEWEFEDAVRGARAAGRPTVLLYRRAARVLVDTDAADLAERLVQKRRVDDFFARLRDPATGAARGGYKRYKSPDEFRTTLENDLKVLVRDRLDADAIPAAEPGEAAEIPPAWQGSPFPGLRSFTPADAPIFFGRGRETDELLARVQDSAFVAVVGASGSGKSSLVAAGLIPRLDQSAAGWALPRYEAAANRWAGLRFTPGELGHDPFLALAVQLPSRPQASPAEIARALAAAPSSIVDHLPAVASLMFIDQFEELFTTTQPALIGPWLELISAVVDSGRCHVVITLRADFYHRCLEIPLLARLLESGQLPLGAPTDTLYDMITRPAQRADLRFEEGLPGRILRDTGSDPESLPLLAYTLDELYRGRSADRLLDFATYRRLGGVQGAIGSRAEHIFVERLDEQARESFAAVFRELVTVDEQGRVTRRRARVARLAGGEPSRRLVEVFSQARLLTLSKDEAGRPIVYVAHEALFTGWRRLAEWIGTMRDDLRLEHQVTAAAAEWAAHRRDEAFRWPHERLEPVYAMMRRLGVSLDADTRAFIEPEYERLFAVLRDESAESHRLRYTMDRLVTIGAVTVPGLLGLLREQSALARDAAADVLARLGEPAIDGLLEALDFPSADVRLAAVGALRAIGSPRMVAGLEPALRDSDSRVRSAAIGVLSAIDDPKALELLGSAAVDGDIDERWLAAGALSAFGPEAVPALLSVGQDDEEAWQSAQRALLAIGADGARQLLAGLRAREPRHRVNAAATLAALRYARQDLVDLLEDQDWDVRWRVCDILAALGDPRWAPAVAERLADPESAVRAAAARALGAMGDEAGIERVVAALGDEEHDVRWAALDAVTVAGAPAAGPVLAAMQSGGPAVAMASAAWPGCATESLTTAALRSGHLVAQRRAAEAIDERSEVLLAQLLTMLAEPPAAGAAMALAALGPRAVPGLINLLDSGSPAARIEAARVLGVIGGAEERTEVMPDAAHPRRALPALERMLGDDDGACREAAAAALARFGEYALPSIWRNLTAPEDEAARRRAALMAAVAIGPAAVPGLLAVAGDGEAAPRESAIAALRAIATPAAIFGLSELGYGPVAG